MCVHTTHITAEQAKCSSLLHRNTLAGNKAVILSHNVHKTAIFSHNVHKQFLHTECLNRWPLRVDIHHMTALLAVRRRRRGRDVAARSRGRGQSDSSRLNTERKQCARDAERKRERKMPFFQPLEKRFASIFIPPPLT